MAHRNSRRNEENANEEVSLLLNPTQAATKPTARIVAKYQLDWNDLCYIAFGTNDLPDDDPDAMGRRAHHNAYDRFLDEYRVRIIGCAMGHRKTVDDQPEDKVALPVLEASFRAHVMDLFKQKNRGDGKAVATEFLRDLKKEIRALVEQKIGPLPPEAGGYS